MSTFGKAIPISLFGESHQETIGITIHNLPAGVALDLNAIQAALNRRKPKMPYHSARKELDAFSIVSGYYKDKTTGAPLTLLIQNKDIDSNAYKNDIARPGHADYTAHIKYRGHNDPRGGGHFSGRLTAPLVALGEISKQILAHKDIVIGSFIKQIHKLKSTTLTPNKESIKNAYYSDFPVLNTKDKDTFITLIMETKKQADSVGGIIETHILNLPPALGDPYFDAFESLLSHLIFSIPAVKGISFGAGFEIASMLGSEANDPITYTKDNTVQFDKNTMGGILGGLTTSQPVYFQTVIKPTPSIQKTQNSIHLNTPSNTTFKVEGRHDPCIVPRVTHVINALSYYTVLELMIRNEGYSWIK